MKSIFSVNKQLPHTCENELKETQYTPNDPLSPQYLLVGLWQNFNFRIFSLDVHVKKNANHLFSSKYSYRK